MDQQIGLLPKTEKDLGIERERDFLHNIMPELKEVAKSKNANPDDIACKILDSYSSIYFRSSLIARIKLRGKKNYISIPERLSDAIPMGTPIEKTASEKNILRIHLLNLNMDFSVNLLAKATLLAIERVPKEFDCCSRFEACSDTKVCIHPDSSFSMLCGYRKILKNGKIFFGKNRNID